MAIIGKFSRYFCYHFCIEIFILCRENRWFTPWGDGTGNGTMAWFVLPPMIRDITGQERVPFGDGSILEVISGNLSSSEMSSSIAAIRIGYEICEELWQPDTQNAKLFGYRGCHLVMNCSGSYWELRKLDSALNHACSATSKSGGVYAYSNHLGCDGGGRTIYYGRSFIAQNGEILQMTTQDRESLFDEVQVIVAWIDPGYIEQYRQQKHLIPRSAIVQGKSMIYQAKTGNFSAQDDEITNLKTIQITDFNLLRPTTNVSRSIKVCLTLEMEEEIFRYCSLWLWDYLRRCLPAIKGFIIPLSGGIDSASVACIVYCLCDLLHKQIQRKNRTVIEQLGSVLDLSGDVTPHMICSKLLRCCYLATKFSGQDSSDRASKLANLIGSEFISYNFTNIFENILEDVPKKVPGTEVTIQQQNVQVCFYQKVLWFIS